MVELFILLAIFLNYIIPFEGIIKLSKSEKRILDEYTHNKIKITDDAEDLISSDISLTPDENGEFGTMNVLGDLDGKSKDDSDFTDVNLKDLY